MTSKNGTDGGVRESRGVDRRGFAIVYHDITLDNDISDGAYRMYALLKMYSHQKNHCWPSVALLAENIGKTEDTASRHLSELEDRGLIVRKRRMGRSSVTWLTDPDPLYYGDEPGHVFEQTPEKSGVHSQKNLLREEEQKEEEKEQAPAKTAGSRPGGKNRKPTNKHPAVQAYREATNLYPRKTLWPEIVLAVGADPPDVKRWRDTCYGYVAVGWNPRNVQGMLQHYAEHRIPSARGVAAPALINADGRSVIEVGR